MQITFYGAAGEVTGSSSLLDCRQCKILVDCGMFQGSNFNEGKNHDPLPFNPAELSAVFVTHAHLDHVGRLPVLVKGGYTGYFYATPPTVELAELIMKDALEIMSYDHEKFGLPVLYDSTDIARVMGQLKPIDYDETLELKGVSASWHDVGHIFGSAFIEIKADERHVVFSGDVGNVDVPILRDTYPLPAGLDALVCESTYGDRVHESDREREQMIEDAVVAAMGRGGVLMIPSFSLERTQELLYVLSDLVRKNRLPSVPIFLDSPLAIGALRVYWKYPQYYDAEAKRWLAGGDDLFQFPGLTLCESREESKKINQVPGRKIIIAGAGMMNGGRIVHHALRYLSDPESTLLIIGYQANGTLGRRLLEGAKHVEILGESVQVHCQIHAIGALSAHADQLKLVAWIGAAKPRQVYLNHGEPAASAALAKKLSEEGIAAKPVAAGMRVSV